MRRVWGRARGAIAALIAGAVLTHSAWASAASSTTTTTTPSTTTTTTSSTTTTAMSSTTTTTSSTTTTAPSTTTPPPATTTTTPPAPAPRPSGGRAEPTTHHPVPLSHRVPARRGGHRTRSAATKARHHGQAAPTGLLAPSPFSLPSSLTTVPAPLAQFQIPLFLLPIYQAAAIQYHVPWAVLAAINEVETNFGTNLAISSAGAEGWMQFIPSTWSRFGADVTHQGAANPYDPTDAIFAAARYLEAAGAQTDLRGAIFAYNHSTAYVDSVLADARQIESVPGPVIDALTGMGSGLFPVHARASYQDAASAAARPHTDIFASAHAPVIASEAGRIVAVGHSRTLGHYIELRDAFGTTYTYADLGSVASRFPVPRAGAASQAGLVHVYRTANLIVPAAPRVVGASHSVAAPQAASGAATSAPAPTTSTPAPTTSAPSPLPVAAPAPTGSPLAPSTGTATNPLSGATFTSAGSGGSTTAPQLAAPTTVQYVPSTRLLERYRPGQARWLPLRAGAVVQAGTVLGWLGRVATGQPHLRFTVRPVAAAAPLIDPGAVLDGWRLLERASINTVTAPRIGQALLMNPSALADVVLSDSRIKLDQALRSEVTRGQIDRRVLATLELLADAGLRPGASAPSGAAGRGDPAAASAGDTLTINELDGIPLRHHRRASTRVLAAVRELAALQGAMEPGRIVSQMAVPDADNAVARPGTGTIFVDYTPRFGANRALRVAAERALGAVGSVGAVMAGSFTADAVSPHGVPAAVSAIIDAGNAIATLPYLWGGGHASFQALGYDCSGSVSYALAAARLLSTPMVSGQFENWGLPGPGRWITIYANADHVWMTVAGWRFDTVALAETGSRWARSGGEYGGFVVRHPAGF